MLQLGMKKYYIWGKHKVGRLDLTKKKWSAIPVEITSYK